MKKFLLVLITIILLSYNKVLAKDMVYSLNKYNNEKLTIIEKSYNEKEDIDGFIVGGTYEKKDKKNVVIAKFSSFGETKWTYSYDKEGTSISSICYTYKDNKIDGYATIINTDTSSVIVKLDLNGKLIEEKPSSIDDSVITKLIPVIENNNTIYYIGISSNSTKTSIIKYDLDFNLVYKKDYNIDNSKYLDIVPIYNDNAPIGLITLVNEDKVKLIRYDLEGENPETIKEDFEPNSNPKLEISNNGYIVYGITNELKLSNNKSTSYSLTKYDINNTVLNDTLGTTPISKNKVLKLLPVIKDNKIEEYLLLYINDNDKSTEAVRINLDLTNISKIKKINNTYYDITNFNSNNDILYIIGQIKCPKDDTCEYNSNSLFLISDQDKVIEVKPTDNKSIIITTCIIFTLIIVLVSLKKLLKH